MSTLDTGEFLVNRGHGVLAFNTDEPYALPVSYGFNDETNQCFVQLFFGEESQKKDHIEKSDGVCLVVYEWNDLTDWRSIVVTGVLRELSQGEMAESAKTYVGGASIPDPSVFSDPLEDLEIKWYELEINSLTERSPSENMF